MLSANVRLVDRVARLVCGNYPCWHETGSEGRVEVVGAGYDQLKIVWEYHSYHGPLGKSLDLFDGTGGPLLEGNTV